MIKFEEFEENTENSFEPLYNSVDEFNVEEKIDEIIVEKQKLKLVKRRLDRLTSKLERPEYSNPDEFYKKAKNKTFLSSKYREYKKTILEKMKFQIELELLQEEYNMQQKKVNEILEDSNIKLIDKKEAKNELTKYLTKLVNLRTIKKSK